ncbi:hypothetical protein HDV05_002943, partial [Chytridiales sp. JEL 0842]
DQVEALAKKGEVVSVITEMEEVLRALVVVEVDEVKAKKEKELETAKEIERRVAQTAQEAKNQSDLDLLSVLQLSYALNTALPTTAVPMTQSQYTALLELGAIVNGNSSNTTTTDPLQRLSVLQAYLRGSSTETLKGVSYADLKNVVSSIVSPVSRPVFTVENGQRFGGAQEVDEEDG